MKIIVMGGAGFIGSNFLNRFVSAQPGHTFVNVDKLGYVVNLANLEPIQDLANYRFVRLDLEDTEAVDAVRRRGAAASGTSCCREPRGSEYQVSAGFHGQ